LLGALLVWAMWTLSGALLAAFVPPEHQARGAALQIVAIGVALAMVLLWRPQGILGERATVSRFVPPPRSPPRKDAQTAAGEGVKSPAP
jgi:branched-chain amino acid transport system permease protein